MHIYNCVIIINSNNRFNLFVAAKNRLDKSWVLKKWRDAMNDGIRSFKLFSLLIVCF